MWLLTTSIYRAPLNFTLMDYHDRNIESEVSVEIPVYLNAGDEFPDIVEASQYVIDKELKDLGVTGWKLKMKPGRGSYTDYNVDFRLGDEDKFVISEVGRDVLVIHTLKMVGTGEIPELVSTVLLDHVFNEEIELFQNKDIPSKVVGYSPRYHLTFSLFDGGGDPISWDIVEALEEYFTPLRQSLSRISNITVDTQVQHYSSLGGSIPEPNEYGEYLLDKEDLSTFINFAEWSLTSIQSYPTLHFILYVPSKDQSPMYIKDSKTNSFSIPQWGGIMIRNRPKDSHFSAKDLFPVLETFSSQLLTLLGTPSSPSSPAIRLDFLSRISTFRALKGTASTLGSLHRLSQSLPNIAIPKAVLYGVEEACQDIQASIDSLKIGEWKNAIVRAGEALQRSESAFFDKMMVQQVFFPEEHKVAIYLPLLGPASVVLLMGTMRMLKEYKEDKRKKKEESTTTNENETVKS